MNCDFNSGQANGVYEKENKPSIDGGKYSEGCFLPVVQSLKAQDESCCNFYNFFYNSNELLICCEGQFNSKLYFCVRVSLLPLS